MTDESFLQETNTEISHHLYTSLNPFLDLQDSQFCSHGEPFYFQMFIKSSKVQKFIIS